MGARQWGVMAVLMGCQGPADPPTAKDTGTAIPCGVQSEALVESITTQIVNLTGGGDWVVWTDRGGSSDPTVTHAIRTDGTGLRTVQQSAPGRDVVSLAFANDQVVYLETEAAHGPVALFAVDIDVGTAPRRLAVRSWEVGARLAGVDDTHAYVIFEDGDDVAVDRIELSTGTPNRVGQAEGVDAPTHVQLQGNMVYFRAGANGGNGAPELYTLRTGEQGRNAQIVGTVGSDAACQFPLGGLAATPNALVCGVGPVFAYDPTGSGGVQILESDMPGDAVVVGSDGETVFTVGQSDSTFDVPVMQLRSDGSNPRTLACDARLIPNQLQAGGFPDISALQAVVTHDAVVWIDAWRGRLVGDPTVTMRRAWRDAR